MKTKNKIGVLVILGGISLIGTYWFKKNKPTIAESQEKDLQALSNYYNTGAGATEETRIEGSEFIAPKVAPISLAQLDWNNTTPKQIADIKSTIGEIYDPTTYITNQISENMSKIDWSELSNLGLAGLTFNNGKIS